MTATVTKTDPRVQVLRSLFRNLLQFKAFYESDGLSEITHEGIVWSIWDLEELHRVAVSTDLLPARQRQAIEMFLVMNMSEADVALNMGILPSNPIGMYASSGLTRLLQEIDEGRAVNPWAEE